MGTIAECDLLPISALQHLVFCERQCALIHVEQLWVENRLTVEGRHLHDRVHEKYSDKRGDCRIVRGMPLRSFRLGLSGIADVVEFHRTVERESGEGQHKDGWFPFPIEYKRGKPKGDDSDRVQLCAQAVCLEEMLSLHLLQGALFYGRTRRRLEVEFDADLRAKTEETAVRLHNLIRSRKTPSARYEKKCDQCSMYDLCIPKTTGGRKSARDYLQNELSRSI